MKTTKTSEAIAARMRKRGWGRQQLTDFGDGHYGLMCNDRDGIDLLVDSIHSYEKTVTAAYREVERQWKEDQVS